MPEFVVPIYKYAVVKVAVQSVRVEESSAEQAMFAAREKVFGLAPEWAPLAAPELQQEFAEMGEAVLVS